MTDTKTETGSHHPTDDPMATRISILSLLRLSIGHMGTEPPTDEEKKLVEEIFKLRISLFETFHEGKHTMIVAMVAITQMLEDILCHYDDDMPDILNAIMAKLSHHGIQHMNLKDNPPKEIKFTGTVN